MAFNWLPLTASVLVALKVPAATLVKVVAVPPWLKVTEVLVFTSSYLTPSAAVLVRLLICVLRLVLRSLTEVLVAFNWLPFTASVLVADTRPAATLLICRSAPTAPTLSTPTGAVPA
ncbi:hypothetical protein [Pseudomonas sp. 25 R 14]|nr:hypothetical protein [Pseudomonas sp. 25 R 14]